MIDRYRADIHFKPRLVTGQILALLGAATMAVSVWVPATGVILLGFGLLGVALMGTLVQMQHDRGMVVSFTVALALFGVVAAAQWAMPEPKR